MTDLKFFHVNYRLYVEGWGCSYYGVYIFAWDEDAVPELIEERYKRRADKCTVKIDRIEEIEVTNGYLIRTMML